MVGITIVNAKRLLDRDGEVSITPPRPILVERNALATAINRFAIGGPLEANRSGLPRW